MTTLGPSDFAAKWSGSSRTERAASQEHFIDIGRVLGVQTPNEADPRGEWFAFEKVVLNPQSATATEDAA